MPDEQLASAPHGARDFERDEQNFRFYDNRQKYLMFVNTCSEKWVVAERTARELESLQPAPPAVRFFDAGMGDGTVLARVLRSMHQCYKRYPFYIAGKEISLEDVRPRCSSSPIFLIQKRRGSTRRTQLRPAGWSGAKSSWKVRRLGILKRQLPPELRAIERGVSSDPGNPLFRDVGKNHLKARLRPHPDVAAIHYRVLI